MSDFQTINPTTGQLVKTFSTATDEEVGAAINNADRAFQLWRRRSVAQRTAMIAKVAALMRERVDTLAQLATLEMGKLIEQARMEIEVSAQILEYYVENGEEFLKPKPLPNAPGSILATEPVGVILAIEPWNFPYYQVARVAGPQLVAGNVLVVKHAPSIPQSALAISSLFKDAKAPDGVYTNIFATVPQINVMIDDFRVQGVTLTGSEIAGAAVAQRSGQNLKKVVLELGGSDPFIILPDASLPEAVRQATLGRMLWNGQACSASKRIIVVGRERGAQVLEDLKKSLSTFVIGDPADRTTTLGPMFAERGLAKLLDQINTAKAHGATIVTGGNRIDRPGFFIEPTIITGISIDNPLSLEETFGPVFSFYVVDSEEEAITIANGTKFGLGASVMGADIERAQEVAGRIEAGMVFINSASYSGPEVPFGGIKNSGFGRELSELGILEFVNKKLVRVAKL